MNEKGRGQRKTQYVFLYIKEATRYCEEIADGTFHKDGVCDMINN
ncbi:MAG: hypothetical protein PUC76_09075 [Clostridia bacterium]|nr:hypothetical protein [Clostridia bacterium]